MDLGALTRRAALTTLAASMPAVAVGLNGTAPPIQKQVAVLNGRLLVMDSGGTGVPIVLLHAFTGSAMSWDRYQRPAFVRAGLRVVAYSRRGFSGSTVVPGSAPVSAVDDLEAVVDALGLQRFHLLGTAAGGLILPDYALSRPERVISMIMACTQGGCVEPSYRAALDRIIPPAFRSMPASFRELAPSYRALNPAGTAQWEKLEQESKALAERIVQPPRHHLDYAALSRIRVPTLVITGGADLYIPPALARLYAARIPNAAFAVLPDSGHSAFWEEPEAFNRMVLDFVARHS